jgi:myo-inositol-1(or 4)-monophosphatase
VDEEAERVITGMLREAYPEYGILAEEGGSTAGTADARWIIDPLDGTTNYAHNFPAFAVSIALERAGEVVAGVVYDPTRDELFAGERGRGATCNGTPLAVSTTDDLGRALLATGFPYDRDAVPAALELWGRFVLRAQGVRRAGSAALDACYVAAGRLDAYYERGIQAWDVAAAALLVEEAGGKITNYRGGPRATEEREIVATNGPLHGALVGLITEATA